MDDAAATGSAAGSATGQAAGPEAQPSLPVPALTVTPSQRARRERMLAAALTLASRGGYEEVQMREVAELAGVALGTLYRYFPSKVHLLAAALTRHLDGLRGRLLPGTPAGPDPATGVLTMMNRLVDELDRDRNVAEALIQAMVSVAATPGIETNDDVMPSLIAEAAFGPDHVVDERDKLTTEIIGKVFLSDLRHWLGGRMNLDDVRSSLASTVEVVLAGQQSLAKKAARR